MQVEHFRNTRTGITWGVNPGTPEHARMVANPGEFEPVEPEPAPKPKRSSKRKPPEVEQAPEREHESVRDDVEE